MKTRIILYPLLTFFVFSFSACNNNDPDDVIPNFEAGSGEIIASIDGQPFQTKSTMDGATFTESSNLVTIQGWTNDEAYISISVLVSGDVVGETYDLLNGGAIFQYQPLFNGGTSYTTVGGQGGGTISFSTYNNNRATGSFEFVGALFLPDGSIEEVSVNGGSFDFNL